MSDVLRVVDWPVHFENNRTRELKTLSWLPVKNKQDGDGYTELILHKNGAAHYGCWHAILGVASKCDPRGTLLRGCKKPHDSASLERMTRIPAEMLEAAIARLLDIGWLEVISLETQEVIDMSHRSALIPQEDATTPQDDALEGKGREGKEQKKKDTPPTPPDGGEQAVSRAEISWRVDRVWSDHVKQWERFMVAETGCKPPVPPTLTDEIRKTIRAALFTYDRPLLAADKREQWTLESKARAAGIGIFLDPFCAGKHKDNDTHNGGKRYLEHWRPWKPQRGKGDPVDRFAELYHHAKEAQRVAAS